MRSFLTLTVVCLGIVVACAATLEKLSLDDMIGRATSIVRGKVGAPTTTQRGPLLYTVYPVAVSEVLKGSSQTAVTVAVPGGANGRMQQTAGGAPQLQPGNEYVLVLWTSRSGLTQIIGLSQGLFTLSAAADATDPMLTRPPSAESVVDPLTRQPVTDEVMSLRMSALRAKVRQSVAQSVVRK